MTELVIDASVVLKWFGSKDEKDAVAARALREAFSAGRLVLHAPTLLGLEMVNVAARHWDWDETRLIELTEALAEMGIAFDEPDPSLVARWAARGLTAYDAAYVALAEGDAISLVTDDASILALAPEIAVALVAAHELIGGSAPESEGEGGQPQPG